VRRTLIALLIVAACGGAQRPRSSGMKELAAEIDAESAELARIIHDLRGDCPRMAGELRTLFARMKQTFDRAHAAQKDPALAKELTTHLRSYDDVGRQRSAAMDADLTENPACTQDTAVREQMLVMPTL
jgi:hypothetical protein